MSFHFKLVSPEDKLFDEPVALVTLPGMDGQFGAGENHTALVSALDMGVVSLHTESKATITSQIFISGGFVDITAERCTVLAEDATRVDALDASALSSQRDQLAKDLDLAVEEGDKILLSRQLEVVDAKIDAVEKAAA